MDLFFAGLKLATAVGTSVMGGVVTKALTPQAANIVIKGCCWISGGILTTVAYSACEKEIDRMEKDTIELIGSIKKLNPNKEFFNDVVNEKEETA